MEVNMKIAFWSSAKGSNGVTSNLACVSIAMAFENSVKTILLENHYQKNTLADMLIHRQAKRKNRNAVNVSRYKGLEHVINQLSRNRYNRHFNYTDMTAEEKPDDELWVLKDSKGRKTYLTSKEDEKLIKEASFEILINSLYYIPIGNQINEFIFDYILNENIMKILWASEIFAGYTFIDTSNINHMSSKIILDEADLVVVNLIQEEDLIDQFFRNYSSLLSKSIVLLSEFNNNSLKSDTLLGKYPVQTSKIIAIPYNMEYNQAIQQGTIVEFMTRNYGCKKDNPNYEFIRAVKRAVFVIQEELDNRQRGLVNE
jgi:hypothetical protein